MIRTSVATSRLLLAVILVAFGFAASAAARDEYQERFTQAAAHEAEGRYDEAIAELAPLKRKHPDDYALSLQLAWLHYQAGDYENAALDYRRASEISRGSEEARLGLAWSLLQLGSAEEAATIFRSILEQTPDLENAQRGLELAEEHVRIGGRPVFSARADFAWVAFQDHPERNSAWSMTSGFGGVTSDVVAWDLTYRFVRFEGKETSGELDDAQDTNWNQHEIYALLGYTRPLYGVHGHFAYVKDESELGDDLFAMGLSGRISRLGRLWVETSLSFYPDDRIFRLSPSWRLPIGGALYLEPGGGLQVTEDGEVLGNGTLELGAESEWGSLRFGGKWGRERRPLYLHLPAVLNLRDDVRWGLWAGASIRFRRTGEVRLTYELNRLDLLSSSAAAEASMHVISASVRGIF